MDTRPSPKPVQAPLDRVAIRNADCRPITEPQKMIFRVFLASDQSRNVKGRIPTMYAAAMFLCPIVALGRPAVGIQEGSQPRNCARPIVDARPPVRLETFRTIWKSSGFSRFSSTMK